MTPALTVVPGGEDEDYWASVLAQGEQRESDEATPQEAVSLPAEARAALLALEVDRLELRDEAARIVRHKRASAVGAPAPVLLRDFLAVQDEPVRYRLEGLWPVGGRVVLAAQYKAGKTTARDNLVRALVDGEPFLGQFPVEPFDGRVVLFDNELDPRMLRRWLRKQGIRNDDRVVVVPLRGRVASFDLLDPEVRAQWAAVLREHDAAVVVLDCLRPVLDALGLSEDKDAGRFLVAFDALLHESGASEAVVVHHMGHAGERSRGDTRLRDWPDVEWRLVRERRDDGEQEAHARRFFTAYGRDVEQPEGLVGYDPLTRRLTLTGGTRQDAAGDAAVPAVLAYLAGQPGATQNAVEKALPDLRRADIRTALRRLLEQGVIDVLEGPRKSRLHFVRAPVPSTAPTAPGLRQRSDSDCASAPIGGAQSASRPEASAPSAQSPTYLHPQTPSTEEHA